MRDVMVRAGCENGVAELTPHGWREHFQGEVELQRRDAPAHFVGA